MSEDNDANIFEALAFGFASNDGVSAGPPDAGPAESAEVLDAAAVAALDKAELADRFIKLQNAYSLLKKENSFLIWECREHEDSLAYYSQTAKFARRLNASDLDTIATVAVNEIPGYFSCSFAAMFLCDENACFELIATTSPELRAGFAAGDTGFVGGLFLDHDHPYLAEYSVEQKAVLVEDGRRLDIQLPEYVYKNVGGQVLVLPLRAKQGGGPLPLTLGGLVIGGCHRRLEAQDAEATIFFVDLLSSSLHNALLIRKLNDMTVIDSLTQIYNRRHLYNQLVMAMGAAARQRHSLAIAIIDIDGFKRFNDVHGHLCGDEVLRQVAMVLKSSTRFGIDLAARYGGEEFMVVLPYTPLDTAMEVANRLRTDIKSQRIIYDEKSLSVTCSIGVAELISGETLENFIKRADASLYQAKRDGRDRVCAAVDSAE